MNYTVENTRPNITFTPKIRERQRFNLSTRLADDEEDNILGLEGLVGQTWNIYAVSALFGVQQDDIHFKLYSKRLREEIASTLAREDVTYNAKFSIMEDFVSRTNQENYPTIKIEVTAEIDDREKKKSLYQGILLSWRYNTETQAEPNIKDLIRLPLLLCRGTSTCIDAVHSIITRMFDCLITALPAREQDLSWLIPIIIMTNKENPAVSGEVQMVYTVPELPVTDTIIVKFQTTELRKILSVIMRNQNDELSYEHIEIFFEVLHKQMLTLGGLELGLCILYRINLPGITIMENKMKIMNVEVMDNVLLYLNDKALDTYHTVHIDM